MAHSHTGQPHFLHTLCCTGTGLSTGRTLGCWSSCFALLDGLADRVSGMESKLEKQLTIVLLSTASDHAIAEKLTFGCICQQAASAKQHRLMQSSDRMLGR